MKLPSKRSERSLRTAPSIHHWIAYLLGINHDKPIRSFRFRTPRCVGVEKRLSGRQVGTHQYQFFKRTMWGWAQSYQMIVILGMIYFWVHHIDE